MVGMIEGQKNGLNIQNKRVTFIIQVCNKFVIIFEWIFT